MEREIITFTDREEIAGIVLGYEHTDQWSIIHDDVTGQGRWVTRHKAIIKRLSDGKYFMAHYTVGSTESQDQYAFEYDEPVLKEVIPKEVRTIAYVWEEE